MTVVTWGDFIDVLTDIKPALLTPGKKTINEIISWVLTLNWQMQGVNQAEINWCRNWIRVLSVRFTGDSKADLLRCIKFLGWVNGTIPYYEIDTKRVCVINNYYWWGASCNQQPQPGEPAPPYVPPPGPGPGFLTEQFELGVVVLSSESADAIAGILGNAKRYYDSWVSRLSSVDEVWAWDTAMQQAQNEQILNGVISPMVTFFNQVSDVIGDVVALDGKDIVSRLLALETTGSTATQKQIDTLYEAFEVNYLAANDGLEYSTVGFYGILKKMAGKYKDQNETFGEMSLEGIKPILKSEYNLIEGTINNILGRLEIIEQEIGIVTEQVSGEIERPEEEVIKPIQNLIPATQAWVIKALTKAGNIIFDAIQSVTSDLANAINYIVHHVVDISDEWLEKLKLRLGSVSGTYDLEADPIFQEVAATAKAAEKVITELPAWWVQSLAISLQDYLTTGGSAPGPAGPQGPGGPPGPMGPIGPIGPASEEGEGIGFNIEAIDTGLKDRIAFGYAESDTLLTETITRIMRRAVLVGDYIDLEVKPITDFLTVDMQSTLTEIAEAFETPEALIAFLLDVPEGQENITFDLWQILVTQIMERGLE